MGVQSDKSLCRVQGGNPGKQRAREGPEGAADWTRRRLAGNPRSGFVRQAPACPPHNKIKSWICGKIGVDSSLFWSINFYKGKFILKKNLSS